MAFPLFRASRWLRAVSSPSATPPGVLSPPAAPVDAVLQHPDERMAPELSSCAWDPVFGVFPLATPPDPHRTTH